MMCVERSLVKCPDPTPANLVQALLQAMKDVTPCTTSQAGHQSRSAIVTLSHGQMEVETNLNQK